MKLEAIALWPGGGSSAACSAAARRRWGPAWLAPLVAVCGQLPPLPRPDFSCSRRPTSRLPPGKSRMLMYGPIPVLLLRPPQAGEHLRIFVATCTHLNCTVGYREAQNCIFCACHEGTTTTRPGRFRSAAAPLRPLFSKQKNRQADYRPGESQS